MDIGSSPILVVHNGFNTILKLQWNFCILKGVSVYKQCIFFMKFENTVICSSNHDRNFDTPLLWFTNIFFSNFMNHNKNNIQFINWNTFTIRLTFFPYFQSQTIWKFRKIFIKSKVYQNSDRNFKNILTPLCPTLHSSILLGIWTISQSLISSARGGAYFLKITQGAFWQDFVYLQFCDIYNSFRQEILMPW